MNYARINYQSAEQIVIETFVPPIGFAINDCFTPGVVAQFEQVPDEVGQNWVRQPDGTWVAPPPAPEPPEESETLPAPVEPITAPEVSDNTSIN
jgi:hypothetical protein